MAKPKLIILNGAPGAGKSTLAERYADEHPLTLRMDIDEIRRLISHWRELNEASGPMSKHMAAAMVRIHLQSGHDVIVPQIYRKAEYLEELEQIAREVGANFYEILLFTEKDEAIRRFIERNKREGYPTGFRPGGITDRGGREQKLASMYDEMMAVVAQRPNTIRIQSIQNDIDGTYRQLLDAVP